MRISDWSSDVCSSDLLAAKAGATFVSPFVGRHDDNGFDGMDLISDIRLIYDNYAYETEILVASIRHGVHATGRESCRERVRQYVKISVAAVSVKQTSSHTIDVLKKRRIKSKI